MSRLPLCCLYIISHVFSWEQYKLSFSNLANGENQKNLLYVGRVLEMPLLFSPCRQWIWENNWDQGIPKLLSPRPKENLCVLPPLISPGVSFSDSPGKQQRGLPVRLSRCLTFGKGAARFLNFLEESPGPTIWDLRVVCPSAEWAFCRLTAVGVGSFSLSCTHLALTHVHPGQELWIQGIPEREAEAKERHVDRPSARAALSMKELLLLLNY